MDASQLGPLLMMIGGKIGAAGQTPLGDAAAGVGQIGEEMLKSRNTAQLANRYKTQPSGLQQVVDTAPATAPTAAAPVSAPTSAAPLSHSQLLDYGARPDVKSLNLTPGGGGKVDYWHPLEGLDSYIGGGSDTQANPLQALLQPLSKVRQ